MTLFGPRHASDPATQMSADQLAKPLSEGDLSGRVRCQFESIWGDAATHEAITEVLGAQGREGARFPVHGEPWHGIPAWSR